MTGHPSRDVIVELQLHLVAAGVGFASNIGRIQPLEYETFSLFLTVTRDQFFGERDIIDNPGIGTAQGIVDIRLGAEVAEGIELMKTRLERLVGQIRAIDRKHVEGHQIFAHILTVDREVFEACSDQSLDRLSKLTADRHFEAQLVGRGDLAIDDVQTAAFAIELDLCNPLARFARDHLEQLFPVSL